VQILCASMTAVSSLVDINLEFIARNFLEYKDTVWSRWRQLPPHLRQMILLAVMRQRVPRTFLLQEIKNYAEYIEELDFSKCAIWLYDADVNLVVIPSLPFSSHHFLSLSLSLSFSLCFSLLTCVLPDLDLDS
jgi:hypothetical protein